MNTKCSLLNGSWRSNSHSATALRAAGALALAFVIAGAGGCQSGDSDLTFVPDDEETGDPGGFAAGGPAGGAGQGGAGQGGAGQGGAGQAGAGGSAGTTSGSGTAAGGGGPVLDYCSACGSPATAGAIADDDIEEASGLVASAIHPGVFYVHNDSGSDAEIFAIGAAGQDLGAFDVEGASAVDWEDIARGPCSAGSCLYLADIGDNDSERSSYTIYRAPEPGSVGSNGDIQAAAFSFTYPDGSHNAETLLVHPDTGVITLVTKVASGKSSVYELELPSSPAGVLVATKTGEIAPPGGSPRFTGGDVHPAGLGVLLRTSTHALFYPASPGQRVAETLAGAPCAVPVAAEEQGEAIAWSPGGAGYVTVSEGSNPDLHAVECGP
jgi:hypothetical protein